MEQLFLIYEFRETLVSHSRYYQSLTTIIMFTNSNQYLMKEQFIFHISSMEKKLEAIASLI